MNKCMNVYRIWESLSCVLFDGEQIDQRNLDGSCVPKFNHLHKQPIIFNSNIVCQCTNTQPIAHVRTRITRPPAHHHPPFRWFIFNCTRRTERGPLAVRTACSTECLFSHAIIISFKCDSFIHSLSLIQHTHTYRRDDIFAWMVMWMLYGLKIWIL